MEARVRYAVCPDGTRIAYTVAGDGPPLLCAPPMLSHQRKSWEQSRSNLWDFAALFRVVTYDIRGVGLSQKDRVDVSIDAMCADLEFIADRAGFGKFALCGARTGANLAAAFAARCPERVTQLILMDLCAPEFGSWDGFPDLLQLMDTLDWTSFSEVFATRLVGLADPEITALTAALIREATSPAAIRASYDLMSTLPILPLLSRIRVPTLVVEDERVDGGTELGQRIAAAIPGASFLQVNDPTYRGFPSFVADFIRADSSASSETPSSQTALSRRETDVLRLVAGGKTNREVAAALTIAAPTVSRHLANIYAKLGLKNRAEAAAYAIRAKLVP